MTNPLRINTKPKHEILNRSRISETPCRLDYRPLNTLDTSSELSLVIRFVLLGFSFLLLQAVVGWILSGHPVNTLSFSFFEMFCAGICLAVLQLLGKFGCPGFMKHSTAALLALGFFFLIWLMIFAFRNLASEKHALVGLILIGFPLICYWINQITTLLVFWYTAHPLVSPTQMARGREAWEQRHVFHDQQNTVSEPFTHQIADTCFYGWLRLVLCWLIPLGMGLYFPSLTGMALIGLWSITLVIVALFQWARLPDSLSVLLAGVNLDWNYGVHQRLVPWMFTSPTGAWWKRQLLTLVTLGVLSICLVHLSWSSLSQSAFMVSSDLFAHFYSSIRPLLLNWMWTLISLTFLPMVVMLSSLMIVFGPLLWTYYQKYETSGDRAPSQTQSISDSCSARLTESSNPIEQRSLLMGVHPATETPVLLDSDLLFEHMHILGATGSGKTALGLTPLVIQLIRKQDGPVLILDNKGDNAYFQTVKLEAEKAGRTFKWFTNRPHHSTYVFNPFLQKHLDNLSLQEILGLTIQSLNLHHGDDYGRAWFTISSRMLLKKGFLEAVSDKTASTELQFGPIESFQDLHEIIEQLVQQDEKQFQAGQHLKFLVESLAQFEQLNLSPSRSLNQTALENAIHMPDVIQNNEVIYFSLVGALDLSSVAEIARLAIFSALAACINHRETTGERPRFYCVIDEAQTVIGQNIQMVLAQAREHGLACILSHQTMSQLNPPGAVDLRELVMSCTTVKQYFSARDPFLKNYISESSGQVPYYTRSWDQLKDRALNDELGPEYACGPQSDMRISISETVGPRLTLEDIEDINRHPNQSVLMVERNSGYSCFHGAFPLQTDWPFTKEEHQRRNFELSWPESSEETLTVTTSWKESPQESTRLPSSPDPSETERQQQTQAQLTQLQKQLQEKKKEK